MKKTRLMILLVVTVGLCTCISHADDEKSKPKAPIYTNDITVIDDAAIARLFEQQLGELIDPNDPNKITEIKVLTKGLENKFHEVSLPVLSDSQKTAESIYKDCSQSIFIVGVLSHCRSKKCKKWHLNSVSSGFFITETGVAVTNYHVMNKDTDGYMAIMTRDKKVYPISKILAGDAAGDIAIIQIDAAGNKFQPVSIAPYAPVGSDVYVIHHPKRNYFTMTSGKVSRYYQKFSSAHNKDDKDASGDTRAVTTMVITADFAKGSSGAPILDKYGRAIGMVRATSPIYYKEKPRGSLQMVLKLCVPAEDIMKLITKTDRLRKKNEEQDFDLIAETLNIK